MGILDWLKGRKDEPQVPTFQATPVVVRKPEKRAPGTRVYHEYFTEEHPHGCAWMCRVYAADGTVTVNEGNSATKAEAAAAAIAWAESFKAKLRGEA